jgi:hypothetical protein
VPRPFDPFGFYLADAGDVFGFERLDAQRREIFAGIAAVRTAIAELTGDGSPTEYRDFAARILDPPTLEERLPPWGEETNQMVASCWNEDEELNLANLELSERIEERLVKWRGLHRDLMAKLGRARRDPAGEMIDAITAGTAFLESADNALLHMWAVRQGLTMLPRDGDTYRELERFQERLRFPYFLERASYILEPDPATGAIQQRLDDFLRRFPGASGILVLRGPAKPIRIEAGLGGRLVLACDRVDVELSAPAEPPPEGDILTVAVFGATLRVRGKVPAAVMLGPGGDGDEGEPVLDIPQDASIVGALVMDHVAAASRMEGSVVRDTSYLSSFSYKPDGRAVMPDKLWVQIAVPATSLTWSDE